MRRTLKIRALSAHWYCILNFPVEEKCREGLQTVLVTLVHYFWWYTGKPAAVFSQSAKCIFLGWRHWVNYVWCAFQTAPLLLSWLCINQIIMKYIYKAWTFNLKNIDLSTQNSNKLYTSTHWDMSSGKWVTATPTVHTHTQECTHMHTNIHTHTHTACTHMCMCTHTHKHACTQTHVSTRAYTHTQTYMHTHTHTHSIAQHIKQLKLRTRFVALV